MCGLLSPDLKTIICFIPEGYQSLNSIICLNVPSYRSEALTWKATVGHWFTDNDMTLKIAKLNMIIYFLTY